MTNENKYENPLASAAGDAEELVNSLPVNVALPDDFSEDLQKFFLNLDWKNVDTAAYVFDPTEEDIRVSYTLEWQGTPLAPIGGICGMNGRPGNGKTMSFSTMIAAMLKGEYMGLRCPMEGEQKVLYADTEMEKVNHQRTVRRIYEMVGWKKGEDHRDRLDTLTLRKAVDAKDRLKIIIKRIWEYKPTAVFIDGIIDLVDDFNDNKECQLRIYQMMALAEKLNIVVWTLLHLNPGSEKSVGHLGSFLERKATDILLTSQDKETQMICISHEKHRFRKIEDINYEVEDDENHYGIPKIKYGAIHIAEPEEHTNVRKAMLSIQWSIEGLRYTEVEAGLKAYGITSKRKLSDYISIAQSMGLVTKDEDSKRYFIQYEGAKIDTQISIDNDNSLGDDDGDPF